MFPISGHHRYRSEEKSMSARPVVLLEFNELTPALLDRFIGEGVLPNFGRLRNESVVFTTHADEPEHLLEPWVQWVTVHTGLAGRDHKVFRLDQGQNLDAPRVWDILSDHGLTSWVCGSMNVRYEPDTKAMVLPDPWCTKIRPQPAELAPYVRFVQANVQDHASARVALAPRDYAAFAAWMVTHGLSIHTVAAIAKQLASEPFQKATWKRVTLLDRLQFDVFAHYYRKARPAFSTFFLNSTAHYQHAYWHAFEPQHYSTKVTERTQQRFGDAIRFGYQQMDTLLGRMFRLIGDDATLVFSTALSQYPHDSHRQRYRIAEFATFTRLLDLGAGYVLAPVMADQFYVDSPDAAHVERAERALRSMSMNGEPLMRIRREGLRLFGACGVQADVAAATVVATPTGSVPFSSLFVKVPTGKLAEHHPDGALWIRARGEQPHRVEERVPLTAVAPTLLQLLGVAAPAQMRSVGLLASRQVA
jgi:hypothetical protein